MAPQERKQLTLAATRFLLLSAFLGKQKWPLSPCSICSSITCSGRLGWSVYYSVVILLLSFCGRYISALLQIFLPEI